MEETAVDIKTFLKEYNDSLSSTSEFNINPKIVGNYVLNRQDVATQVIDWVLYYLEDRQCPYSLAVSIAKETAQQIEESISEQQLKETPTSDGKLLNSLTLYNDAIKKLTSICKSYLEEVNEMEIQSFPITYATSVFAIKNKRRKMEDRHVIHHDLNLLFELKDCPHHSYYAVFDGHSGIDAASYASAHLHVNIVNHPAFLTDTSTAIAEAYKTTDQNFIKKCYEENFRSGTTAVCALIREKTVFLSWVGDSQAVLVKGGKPSIVTSPHKPDREDEKKRVEDLGGTIQFIGTYRVNGLLAVTRAIGDADHKPFISSEPEITVVDLDGSEDFLILACDGLWDGMSPEDVVTSLYYNILENEKDNLFETMAAKLVHQSLLQGSEDNITAVVIFLKDIKVIKEEAQNYVPNLSKANLQGNFYDANGDENSMIDMITSTPLSKPNKLEFNNSSIKKLKNTANVLSAAGLGDSFTDYVETYASNFDKLAEPSTHLIVAPETTALSELPTPPIDDVIASQQFEKICPTNLAQKFEVDSPNSSSGNSPLNTPDINLDYNFIKEVQPVEAITENDKNDFLSEELSPEEAVDIASTVVSNAIETAVKCISEKECNETKVHTSSQKLNPYAEPFVMKSFVPAEAVECDSVNVCPPAPELSAAIFTKTDKEDVKELMDVEVTSSDEVKNNVEVPVLETAQDSVSELISSTNMHNALDQQVPANSVKTSENLTLLENVQISLVDNSVFDLPASSVKISENVSLLENMQISLVDNSVFDLEETAQFTKEDLSISPAQQLIDNLMNKETTEIISMQDTIRAIDTKESLTEENFIEITSQNSVIEVSDEKVSPSKELLESDEFISQNSSEQNEVITGSKIITYQTTCDAELIDFSSNLAKDDAKLKFASLDTDICVESNSVASGLCATSENSPATDSLNISLCEDQIISSNEEQVKSDKGKETKVFLESEKIPEAAIILGGVALPLVDDKAAAVLPSDHLEESQAEAVAVDLQSVPVGVPEAEGVTEDVDSDSEKDGGWSYMKGNVAGEKNKSLSGKVTKDISKLKKDAPKAMVDAKSKIRSTVNVDKTKKVPAEKKPLEIRSKMAKPMPANTSKTTVDKAKVATTIAARKPVSATKTTSVPSSKMSRPTTVPRSLPVQNKSGVSPSTSRLQNTSKPTALNDIKVKQNTRVSSNTSTTTTNSLIKKQPSSQSIKSSTLSSARSTVNRPATVPNRALSAAKSATLQKTSFDSKPKLHPTTLKQTASSTIKKAEVKETKELSNKQLSEKRSTLPKTVACKGAISNVSSRPNSSASGINKITAKPRYIPPKSDLNKDVPKTQISRLATRNTSGVKPTKDTSKTAVKNSSSFQKKTTQKPNLIAKADNKNTGESKPSEEEKLLREVNDVEIPAKGLDDCAIAGVQDNSLLNGRYPDCTLEGVQDSSFVENGHDPVEDQKILNDEPVTNSPENLL